mgnify:CR=1 FL=1
MQIHPLHHDPTYWALVQELMSLGWYRAGSGPDQDGGKTWGFRRGHLIDSDPGAEVRWILARNETTAMRQLLDDLAPRPKRKSRRTSLRL